MSRDSGDFDIDDSSENVLSEWPRAADEPSGGDSEGSRERPDVVDRCACGGRGDAARGRSDRAGAGRAGAPRRGAGGRARVGVPETEPEIAAIAVEPSLEHAAGELEIPEGYAVLEGVPDGGRRAVGIVVARFNGSVTSQLLDRALAELETAGVRPDAITIMVVPGAFELPIAATALAKTRRFACIVALGCVIRGDTPHFDYVAGEAASGLQLAALETGVPVSFGVLTLERVEQAEPRIEKGAEAVRSALEMADDSSPSARCGCSLAAAATLPGRMSKVCAICGKKPGFGNNRSHSMVATRRRFNPNLQRVRVLLEGHATRAYVCTRCLKAGKVQRLSRPAASRGHEPPNGTEGGRVAESSAP